MDNVVIGLFVLSYMFIETYRNFLPAFSRVNDFTKPDDVTVWSTPGKLALDSISERWCSQGFAAVDNLSPLYLDILASSIDFHAYSSIFVHDDL